jgi:hypothetical protein
MCLKLSLYNLFRGDNYNVTHLASVAAMDYVFSSNWMHKGYEEWHRVLETQP